jgi:hypothetical protein
MTYRELLADLDKRFKKAGPCAICGGPDKRHRLWDALDSQSRGSLGVAGTARWMDVPVDDVLAVRAAYNAARRGHRRRPGAYPL